MLLRMAAKHSVLAHLFYFHPLYEVSTGTVTLGKKKKMLNYFEVVGKRKCVHTTA